MVLNASLGRDAHNWLSQAIENWFHASSFSPHLPSFLPPNDRGKGSRRTGPQQECCSCVSPLGLCFGDNGSPLIYTLHLLFTATGKFRNHFGNKMKTYHLLFGHWWICWKTCFMINVTLKLTTWCEFSLSESDRNYKIIQENYWSYRIVRIFLASPLFY